MLHSGHPFKKKGEVPFSLSCRLAMPLVVHTTLMAGGATDILEIVPSGFLNPFSVVFNIIILGGVLSFHCKFKKKNTVLADTLKLNEI